MIEWISNEQNQAVIYQIDDVKRLNKSNLSVIKSLCMTYLFTYEGYLKAVKQVFNYRYRIPLYISDELMLIATRRVRDYENIWINYASITHVAYEKNCINMTFASNKTLKVSMTQYAWQQQVKRLMSIKLYISKHFHSSFYRK